jgi:DNA-binding response OmpR family regulator
MTRVLIIDDDEQLRAVVSRVLAPLGFACDVVESIPDAQASIATRGPDIVLLDIGLGASSGLDIHRALRDSHARLPAVIFTTSHRNVFPEMMQQLGPMDDWIIRPWDSAEFIARVRLAERRVLADRAGTSRAGDVDADAREDLS